MLVSLCSSYYFSTCRLSSYCRVAEITDKYLELNTEFLCGCLCLFFKRLPLMTLSALSHQPENLIKNKSIPQDPGGAGARSSVSGIRLLVKSRWYLLLN